MTKDEWARHYYDAETARCPTCGFVREVEGGLMACHERLVPQVQGPSHEAGPCPGGIASGILTRRQRITSRRFTQ